MLSLLIVTSSIIRSPSLLSINPTIISINVVLPLPLAPTIPIIEFFLIVNSSSLYYWACKIEESALIGP